MQKRGQQDVLVKIAYLILFLLLVALFLYVYKTKLKEGVFNF